MTYQSVNAYDGKILKTFEELTDKQLETALEIARQRFIGAIGGAATILNDEQCKHLTGFAAPASAASASAPTAGDMIDM